MKTGNKEHFTITKLQQPLHSSKRNALNYTMPTYKFSLAQYLSMITISSYKSIYMSENLSNRTALLQRNKAPP